MFLYENFQFFKGFPEKFFFSFFQKRKEKVMTSWPSVPIETPRTLKKSIRAISTLFTMLSQIQLTE